MQIKHLLVLINIRNKGNVGTVKHVNFLTDRSKAFVDHFVICDSC